MGIAGTKPPSAYLHKPLLTSLTIPDPPVLQQEPRTLAISMFADAPPYALEAVTNGVRVRVSSIFIPEHSRELPPRFFFAYRCSALPRTAYAQKPNLGRCTVPPGAEAIQPVEVRFWWGQTRARSISSAVLLVVAEPCCVVRCDSG